MRAKAVKRPGHDQFFKHPAVELFGIGACAQIKQLAEITTLITRFDNGLNRPFAYTFDCADAVNNLPVIVNVEMIQPGVNVGRQDLQPHSPTFIDQAHDLIGVIHIRRHDRCHKLRRIVRLQPKRLVGYQSIGRRVRFVKSITCEFLHKVEDFHRQFAVNAVILRALFKYRALLRHFFRFLFTHGTTQHVRAAKGIAGKHLGNLHYLFLVQDNAVGGLQNGFQAFMLPLNIRIGDRFTAMLTVDKVIHHARLQRPRTEQGHQCDHVFETVRLQAFDQVLHAA